MNPETWLFLSFCSRLLSEVDFLPFVVHYFILALAEQHPVFFQASPLYEDHLANSSLALSDAAVRPCLMSPP